MACAWSHSPILDPCLVQEVAQRALVSYLRSVFLQPNRKVFDVTQVGPAAVLLLLLRVLALQ